MPSAVTKGKSRNTRYSSPLVRSATPAVATEPSEWTEPSVKDASASYEDHGGTAFGVLEDMQPLGQRPSAKVRTRVKPEPLRKSLGRSMGTLHDYNGTPEGTPSADTPRSASLPREELVPAPLPTMEEGDGDYRPSNKKPPRTRATRGSSGIPEIVKTASPSLAPSTRAPRASSVSTSGLTSKTTTFSPEDVERINFAAVVDSAEQRARDMNNDTFGAALRQVYEESHVNERNGYLLRAILLQTATDEEKGEFTAAIKKAKRALRKSMPPKPFEPPDLSADEGTPAPPDLPNGVRPSVEREKVKPMKLRFPAQEAPVAKANSRMSTRNTRRRSLDKSSPAPPALETRSESHMDNRLLPHLDDTDLSPATMDTRPGTPLVPSAHDIAGSSDAGSTETSLYSAPLVWDSYGPNTAWKSDLPEFKEYYEEKERQGVMEREKREGRSEKRKRAGTELQEQEQEETSPETSKRRKLNETLFRDPPEANTNESHIRESTESSRSLRNRAPVNYKPVLKLTNNAATPRQKRAREPSDSPLSDMSMSPPPVPDPPVDRGTGRARKKAKVKQSPEKKQKASAEEKGGRGGSPIASDDDAESDNSDHCNACGGTGYLLCCDGCDRAFHFNCVDPPLDVYSSALDEPWFCHTCVAKKQPQARQPRGLFSGLLQGLEKRNPSIFALPQDIRSFFANVVTSKDGKFEDVTGVKSRPSRVGYDGPPDLLKTKDTKGNSILCYFCGRSSAGKREIIPCDVCGNHWHLDCTDPPLANPPSRDDKGNSKHWMCPLHVEHDLSAIDPIRLARRRKLHVRRPKNARIADTSLRRGFSNNGHVEILDEPSSAEESEFEEDETVAGTVMRLPAKGVKLDFIDKVHRVRALEDEGAHLPPAKRTRMDSRRLRAELNSRAVKERKAALELVQFAAQRPGLDLAADGVENLIYNLTAEAPVWVIDQVVEDEDESHMPNGLASPPASDQTAAATTTTTTQTDQTETGGAGAGAGAGGGALTLTLTESQREELEALKDLIDRRLAAAAAASSAAAAAAAVATGPKAT